MTRMANLIDKIERRNHESCKYCPLSSQKTAFGKSCPEHYFNWLKSDEGAKVISIAKDPGGTSPEKTGVMCIFCNYDPTASTASILFKVAILGVSPEEPIKKESSIFQVWYDTNAIKHGIPRELDKDDIQLASTCCSAILREEISILKPEVIRVAGSAALKSLMNAGIIENAAPTMKNYAFSDPLIKKNYYGNGQDLHICFIYHTSPRTTNMTLPRYYGPEIDKEIERYKRRHPNPGAIEDFKEQYKHRAGMMVHLYLWLKFADRLRELSII